MAITLLFKLVIFILFILISAFFSGAETAFTGSSRIKLRSILDKNKQKSSHLEFLLNHPKQLLTCILIGNNLANIAATTFATAFFIDMFQTMGIYNFATTMTLITIIVTFILLIFGEITPKTLAMKNPSRWAFKISSLIYYIYILIYPLIILFYSFTRIISKLFGISLTKTTELTEEEIKLLIQLGREDGILEQEEQKMIHGVINVFNKVVREIMTPRTDMVSIELKTSVSDAIEIITTKGHSRIPIYEDKIDNIVGFVFAKDLISVNPSIKTHNLRSFMRDAVFIPETKEIQSLLQQMKQTKFHLAIVVDEHGGVSGLVTLEDIIEEIVGEIHDEYDSEKSPIKKLTSTHYIIDAGVSINSLSELLSYEFPQDEDYDTVAGFILSQLGSFPKKNQKVQFDKFEFIVRDIKKRRIMSFDVKILIP